MITIRVPKISSFVVIAVLAVVVFIFARPKPIKLNLEGYAGYHLSVSQVVDNATKLPLTLEASMYMRRVEGSATPIIEAKLKDVYLTGSATGDLDNRSFDGLMTINFSDNGTIEALSLPADLNDELAGILSSSLYTIETIVMSGGGGRWRAESPNGGVSDYILVSLSKVEKRRVSLPDTAATINSSTFLASITGTFWLESIEGSESILYNGYEGQVHRYDTKIKLKTIPYIDPFSK